MTGRCFDSDMDLGHRKGAARFFHRRSTVLAVLPSVFETLGLGFGGGPNVKCTSNDLENFDEPGTLSTTRTVRM